MEPLQSLLSEIEIVFTNAVPDKNWDRIKVRVFAISTFLQMKGVYFIGEKEVSYNPNVKTPSGTHASIRVSEMRKMMYDMDPEKGAWYTMVVEIDKSGKFKVNYDYDNKPEFTLRAFKREIYG